MPSPKEIYAEKIQAQLISPDSGQAEIVDLFEALFEKIVAADAAKPSLGRFLTGWMKVGSPPEKPARGLYLWGGVGRGKTFLMDIFFESLPIEKKSRTHFHRFMQSVHKELTLLQGHKNPLEMLAGSIARESKVLCFDEFFVLDIADAMILSGLLEELFNCGVILVTTSNIDPDGLYENGLQRERFLPAIELIKSHTTVTEIQTSTDYRLRSLSQAKLYLVPNDAGSSKELASHFSKLTQDRGLNNPDSQLLILDRSISTRCMSGDVVWFDFDALCAGPRSAFDYVEIAKLFHTVLISNIPQMSDATDDVARRFVSLIDELYDRRVKLIVSAAVSIESLYSGKGLAFAFERTTSRLLEMQSHEYLCTAHQS